MTTASAGAPARREPPSSRTLAAEALIIGAAIALLYVATLAGNHTEAEDAVRYMLAIRSGDPAQLSSPYHVLWHWLAFGSVEAARAMGYGGDPYPVVQLLDAALGALGVSVAWLLLRSAGLSKAAAGGGTGLLAFSFGYWWYSVEAEVYVLAGVFLLTALGAARRSVDRPTLASFSLLGAAVGLAILAHVMAVLAALVIPVAALAGDSSLRARIWRSVASALVTAGVLLPGYAAAAIAAGVTTPARIADWLTGYAQSGRWGHLEASNLYEGVFGSARAIVGGHFLFALSPVESTLRVHAREKLLREEFFLADSFSGPQVLALSIGAVVVAVALVAIISGLMWVRSAPHPVLVLAMLAASMLVPLALFGMWWEPYNHELWIAPLVPLSMLVGIAASRLEVRVGWPPATPTLVACFLVSLFAVNLLGSILPQRSEATDYWRTRVRWYEHNASGEDVVLASNYMWTAYIRYFGQVNAINAAQELRMAAPGRSAARQVVEDFLAAPAGGRYVSEEVLDPASDAYSTCDELEARLVCAAAPAFRRLLRERVRIVGEEPLERVWEVQ